MPLRTPRFLIALLAFVVLGACSSDGNGPFEPLPGGTALPVTLATTTAVAAGRPPRLQIIGLRGEAVVTWDLESAPCLLADASALRSGSVIEVHIRRSGNPAALCAPGSVAYHYEARAQVATPGAYEVRLVDDLLGQPPRSVGRLLVSVLPLL